MSIAVIGTGKVGTSLAGAFERAGLDVVLGSRNPAGVAGGSVKVVSIEAALAGAETVVLALTGTAVDEFLAVHGRALDGALVVDATNRLDNNAVMHSAEQVAATAPGARYARAFNSMGVEVFDQPQFDGVQADLLFSADEADRPAVEQLVAAVGLRPVYLGPGKYAELDTVLIIWHSLAVGQGHGRHLGFRLLTD